MRALWGLVFATGCRLHFDAGLESDAPPMTSDVAGDSARPIPISCTSLPATCQGTHSCCEDAEVPGGGFLRNNDAGSDGAYGTTTLPATISAVRLDRFEVTVGRFRAFVDAGMGTATTAPSANAGARTLNGTTGQGGWDPAWNNRLMVDSATLRAQLNCSSATWTDAPGANELLPIACLTWYEAFAFCVWDGGFLPTEAEWNFTASGGDEQRAYPWSNPPSQVVADCAHTNIAGCGNLAIAVGGNLDVGRWGHADMSGNLHEWVLDSGVNPPPVCDNCADLSVSATHSLRGGALDHSALESRPANHIDFMSDARGFDVGMRCARLP